MTSRRIDCAWLLVCGLASSAWCLSAAAELGATFDEPIYVTRGLDGWRHGTHAPLLNVGTMPLPADVATLPLYVYERWTGTTFDFRAGDQSRPLFWARSTTLLFWWLLLFFAMRVARELAGPWGGRLAVVFLACDPNLLAHASLATTDVPAAAMFLACLWHFVQGREQTAWRRVIVPGVWFGLALFTKASALVFIPLACAIIEWRRRRGWHARCAVTHEYPVHAANAAAGTGRPPTAWRDFARIGLIGIVVVFLLCGCDGESEHSFVRWADALPEGCEQETWQTIANNLKIFPNAGVGLVKQIRHNLRGHSTYLLGIVNERSLWYYYPVLYTIKTPEPWLLLTGLLLLSRPRSLLNWACLAAGGLALYCVTCRVQIGIRLMLPWMVLGVVGLAAAVVAALDHEVRERRFSSRGKLLLGVVAASIAWLAWSAWSLWPDGLRYVNAFWGGPAQGHRLVSDSNFDWGQGLKELARWQRQQGIPHLNVCYVGTDPLLTDLPMTMLPLQHMSVSEVQAAVRGRWLAVSATWLHGAYIRDADAVGYLRSLVPAARTSTFFLFDFTR